MPSPWAVPSPSPGHPSPQYPTNLQWRPYPPSTEGPWPFVIILHIGGWWSGDWTGDGNMVQAANDLAAAGFYAVIPNYTLAPRNVIDGQPAHSGNDASGRPPWQTDDVKALVNAARNSTLCNGVGGVLGGSAGGTHAAFVAFDSTDTVGEWPHWNSDARPDFVVCLSGAYDLSDRVDTTSSPKDEFIKNVENYTNTTVPADQWGISPVAIVPTSGTYRPIYFLHTDDDPMPVIQQWDMFNALYYAGYPTNMYRMWTIPDGGMAKHAFGYWEDPIYDTVGTFDPDYLVRDRVINYFQYFLQQANTTF
ncbi:MAG TPA: hypothetical protein VGG02_14150 [Chthoniobacterales bacterium]